MGLGGGKGSPALSGCCLIGLQCGCMDIWWSCAPERGLWQRCRLAVSTVLHAGHRLALHSLLVCTSTPFPFSGPCVNCLCPKGSPLSQLLLPLKALHALPAIQKVSTLYRLLTACSPPALHRVASWLPSNCRTAQVWEPDLISGLSSDGTKLHLLQGGLNTSIDDGVSFQVCPS